MQAASSDRIFRSSEYASYGYGQVYFIQIHNDAKTALGSLYSEIEFNRAILSEDPDSFDEEIKTEVEKLNTEFSENSEKHAKLSSLKDFFL